MSPILYAVLQNGFCFFGVGETPEEAIETTLEWSDPEDHPMIKSATFLRDASAPSIHGAMYVIPVTEELADLIGTGSFDGAEFYVREDGLADVRPA